MFSWLFTKPSIKKGIAQSWKIGSLPADKCAGRKYKKNFINENRHIAVKNSINNTAAYNGRHHTKNHNTYFPAYVHLFYLMHCYGWSTCQPVKKNAEVCLFRKAFWPQGSFKGNWQIVRTTVTVPLPLWWILPNNTGYLWETFSLLMMKNMSGI